MLLVCGGGSCLAFDLDRKHAEGFLIGGEILRSHAQQLFPVTGRANRRRTRDTWRWVPASHSRIIPIKLVRPGVGRWIDLAVVSGSSAVGGCGAGYEVPVAASSRGDATRARVRAVSLWNDR